MSVPRHEFYETDERLTLSVFDKGANPEEVKITFEPRKISYTHGEKSLVLEPLKGQIEPDKCDFTVGKVKVEIRLAKAAHGRWGGLTGEAPDALANSAYHAPDTGVSTRKQPHKNWDGITTKILEKEKEKTTDEDPNVGGDAATNDFFKKLYDGADEDTKRAMLKSYQESGGTALSTNWGEVKKEKIPVQPPTGSEWKQWGA